MLSVAASGFELAALLLDVEAETLVAEFSELRVGAGVGQHEADLQRPAPLRQRRPRKGRDHTKGGGAGRALQDGAAARQKKTFVAPHGVPPWRRAGSGRTPVSFA
jgi:hypothetical protein